MRVFAILMLLVFVACASPAPAEDPRPEMTPVDEPEGDGLVRSADKPWSQWDDQVGANYSFRVEFDFLKKLASHRRKVKLKGILAFQRKKSERAMRLDINKRNGDIDNIVVADAKRFWSFTPGDEDSKPKLEQIDLTKRPGLKGALHTLMLFYGSTKAELATSFSIKTQKTDEDNWDFELVPLENEDLKHVKKITVALEGRVLKSVRFDTKKNEYMIFNINKLEARKLKDEELDFTPPKGTDIVVIEDDSQDAEP